MDNNFNNFEQPSDNNQQENTSDLNNISNNPDDSPNTYSSNSDDTDNITSDNQTVNSSDNQTGYNDYVDISSNQNTQTNQEQIQYYPRPEEYKWNYQQQNSQYNQNNNYHYEQHNQHQNSQYGYNYNNQFNQNTQGYQYSPPQYNTYYNMKDIEQKEKDRPRQGMAIASMVLGICGIILSFCCCCIPIYGSFVSIVVSGIGLVLSILALSAGNRSGFAISGIITCLIGVLVSAALLIILYTGFVGLNEFQSMIDSGYNPFM